MKTREEALHFAQEWVAAWNAHDLDRILTHYTDDFEMTTPFVVKLMNEASGTLTGKEMVRPYWKAALERFPDLHFELLNVFVGVNSVVIHYKSVQGLVACKVLFFNEQGKVCTAAAHYNKSLTEKRGKD